MPLQRAGVRTALITDAGFEDIIEIGRQDRPSLYDGFADRPRPERPLWSRDPRGRQRGPKLRQLSRRFR